MKGSKKLFKSARRPSHPRTSGETLQLPPPRTPSKRVTVSGNQQTTNEKMIIPIVIATRVSRLSFDRKVLDDVDAMLPVSDSFFRDVNCGKVIFSFDVAMTDGAGVCDFAETRALESMLFA